MTRNEDLAALASLIRRRRWAALASLEENGSPYASAVAYAPESNFAGFLLHLSRLAPHTRNLLAHPQASLLISDAEGEGDPQRLMRVSLLGGVSVIEKDAGDFGPAKAIYLERLPDAAPLFEFSDFVLFRFVPFEVRFVGGFARARRMDPGALREASAL